MKSAQTSVILVHLVQAATNAVLEATSARRSVSTARLLAPLSGSMETNANRVPRTALSATCRQASASGAQLRSVFIKKTACAHAARAPTSKKKSASALLAWETATSAWIDLCALSAARVTNLPMMGKHVRAPLPIPLLSKRIK